MPHVLARKIVPYESEYQLGVVFESDLNKKQLLELGLHEIGVVSYKYERRTELTLEVVPCVLAMRVLGGWIYTDCETSRNTFVPEPKQT